MAYPPAGGDRSVSLSLRTRVRLAETRNDDAIAKTTGLCDYFAAFVMTF
ncbi:hypothetical protein [Nostoc sp. FACHB-133]|nr:hypothetical protein [Nostoc sp. FACHB-133]MBD2527822.1 hypothetical protein [Nostoc sp. FACHB-133]